MRTYMNMIFIIGIVVHLGVLWLAVWQLLNHASYGPSTGEVVMAAVTMIAATLLAGFFALNLYVYNTPVPGEDTEINLLD